MSCATNRRSILFGAVLLVAATANAFGQVQKQKSFQFQQPQRSFTLPQGSFTLPQNRQQPAVRSQLQQSAVTPRPQSGRAGANQMRPEDWLRLLPKPAPQTTPYGPGDYSGRYRGDNQVKTRQAVEGPQRPVLTGDQIAALTLEQQRQLLHSAAISVDQELSRLSTGAGWKKFLYIGWLLGAIAQQQDAAASTETRAQLKRVADQFDKTQGNPQNRAISGLWGFQTLRNGLREYAAAPVERSQRQLDLHAATLHRSLAQLPTGAGWQTHLQLNEAIRLAQTKQTLGPPDREQTLQVAGRFQQVAQNPKYRLVAQLEGFDATRRALEQLAGEILQLADSKSPDGVLGLADPDSAAGILQLADPKSPQGVLRLAEPASLDDASHMVQLVQTVLQNLDAMQQACAEDKQRHAAEIKQAQDRLAKLIGLLKQRDATEIKQAQDWLAKLHGLFDEAIKRENKKALDRLAMLHALFDEAIIKQEQDPSKTVELRKEAAKFLHLVQETPEADILPLGVEYEKPRATILPLGVERPDDTLRDLIRETEAWDKRYRHYFREDSPLRHLSAADAERLEQDLAEAKKKLKRMCQSVDEAIAALHAAGAP